MPTGEAALGCRSFVLRCADADVRETGQRVSLDPDFSLGEPSVGCETGNETRALRVFFGAECDLWRVDNVLGCWWDIPTRAYPPK